MTSSAFGWGKIGGNRESGPNKWCKDPRGSDNFGSSVYGVSLGYLAVETARRPRCSFSYIIMRTGPLRIFMTVKRQLLVRSVCVWEEGMAVSQSGFGARRRYDPLLIIVSFVSFSALISCVMYLETHGHYAHLVGFIVCAFYIPPIFLCILR